MGFSNAQYSFTNHVVCQVHNSGKSAQGCENKEDRSKHVGRLNGLKVEHGGKEGTRITQRRRVHRQKGQWRVASDEWRDREKFFSLARAGLTDMESRVHNP
jgi:hypothetical protein